MTSWGIQKILAGVAASWLTLMPGAAQTMKQQRQKAAARPRPLIFNNDGNEPVYLCRNTSVEEFLRHRTALLAGSQVSSIFYCTWNSGLGLVTHATKVGQVFNSRETPTFAHNMTQALLDAGIDPLKVMVDFGRKHNIEVFWSMRMNDVHDANTDYEWGPVLFRTNRFKTGHPEFLFGTADHPPAIGPWSGVDYGRPEVRDYAFRLAEEVCQNYEIDGIELDFNRFPVLFKSNTEGRPATDADRAAMTSLLRRVRAAADAAARKRGRPILIAVRLPDSVDYCRALGLDLEHWLASDLVDLMIVGGYFQLNPWEYSVQLGRKYGIKVYSSIDDSRVRLLPASREMRNSVNGRRAQAMNAWAAGMDGIYLYNFFDPASRLWSELGNPQSLARLDKDYFASVLGVGFAAETWYPNAPFQKVSSLNPDAPIEVSPGKPASIRFHVGDDFAKAATVPKLTLRLQFKKPPTHGTTRFARVTLNGEHLANPRLAGEWIDLEKWLEFDISPKSVRRGENVVTVGLASPGLPRVLWSDLHLRVRFHGD